MFEFMHEIITQLVNQMRDGGDNKGIQYRINADAKWGATVGLKLNHVELTSVPRYLGLVINKCAANQCMRLVERISISNCFIAHPTTGRKQRSVKLRTVYLVLEPKAVDFLHIKDQLPQGIGSYRPVSELLCILKELSRVQF